MRVDFPSPDSPTQRKTPVIQYNFSRDAKITLLGVAHTDGESIRTKLLCKPSTNELVLSVLWTVSLSTSLAGQSPLHEIGKLAKNLCT